MGNAARSAVAYIRVDPVDERGERGEQARGARAQEAAIRAWASRRRVQVTSWQIDRGIEGSTPIAERPGLVAAYAAVREHRAEVLVAATAACFTQDELVAWLIERAAMTEGATLLTADGSFSPAPTSGTWTRGALDLARAYERVVLRSRTRAALAAKRARGERIGAVPYGSRLAADGRHLEADDAEQAVITLVRGLASDGLSQRGIVARLAARGVVGRTGAALGQTQVARLLVRG
jgi:DNA invertase Pin-like site-specific DNA recombinase